MPQGPAAPQAQPEAAPNLGVDVAQGVDGTRTIRQTAHGPQPAAPQYALATPPRVDPPKAVVPGVSLSGSTQNRIDSLVGVQQGQIDAIASALDGMGFTIDPKKTPLGLTPTQQFYADIVGGLMGVEDGVKQTEAYKTLHKLYVSMPNQLSERQLSDLSGVVARLSTLPETVAAATELRVKINRARADGNQADVAWWESRLRIVERDQIRGVEALVADLRGLNYRIDESKIFPGLTGSQAFYNDLSGILTMAEDPVKQSASFKRLAQLYASMPSELSEAQLRQLRGVWAQIRGVDPISDQINALRVQLVAEKAEANRR